jgi:hypothetical protein
MNQQHTWGWINTSKTTIKYSLYSIFCEDEDPDLPAILKFFCVVGQMGSNGTHAVIFWIYFSFQFDSRMNTHRPVSREQIPSTVKK